MSGSEPNAETMVRTSLALGDALFQLAQSEDVDTLKQSISEVVSAGGGFVDFVVVGNRRVSAFVTGAHLIVLAVETVQFDERDTGAEADPFGGEFDLF